jgi:hypothetical protein
MSFDLVVRRARLAGGTAEIGIANGRIAAIGPMLVTRPELHRPG